MDNSWMPQLLGLLSAVGVFSVLVVLLQPALVQLRGLLRAQLPSSQSQSRETPLLSVPLTLIIGVTLLLPVTALCLCLAISLLWDFEDVTKTHCGPETVNFFASISACTGARVPQRYIWTFAVCFYVQERVFSGWIVRRYLEPQPSPTVPATTTAWLQALSKLRHFVHTLEQISLALLTTVSSKDSTLIHQASFGAFWLLSLINMASTTKLSHARLDRLDAERQQFSGSSFFQDDDDSSKKKGSKKPLLEEDRAYKMRLHSALVHYGSSLSAIFWYAMHNYTCDKYFYSYFSIAEWIVIFSNIAFHSAEIVDAGENNFNLIIG